MFFLAALLKCRTEPNLFTLNIQHERFHQLGFFGFYVLKYASQLHNQVFCYHPKISHEITKSSMLSSTKTCLHFEMF